MEVKDNITAISDRLFRKFGIRGVTVDDICSEGGISKKTVYMYFKDKHSIAKNAIDFYNTNLYNHITLSNRIHELEYFYFPQIIEKFLLDKL